MEKYDVVIVGSGIGGLCCGSILALSGKKVLYAKHIPNLEVLLTVSKEKVTPSNQVLHYGVE